MWEVVEHGFVNTERMKVPGGWIVASWLNGSGVNQVFVPDPMGTWELPKVTGERFKFTPHPKEK